MGHPNKTENRSQWVSTGIQSTVAHCYAHRGDGGARRKRKTSSRRNRKSYPVDRLPSQRAMSCLSDGPMDIGRAFSDGRILIWAKGFIRVRHQSRWNGLSTSANCLHELRSYAVLQCNYNGNLPERCAATQRLSGGTEIKCLSPVNFRLLRKVCL